MTDSKHEAPTSGTVLREPTEAERVSFRRAAKALSKLGEAGLFIYLSDCTLNLMVGPSHSGEGIAHPERVREQALISRSDSGSW